MKTAIQKTSLMILLCVASFKPALAQVHTDSLRIIKEALKLIALPEPQFDEPFVVTPSPKDIQDLGFEQPNTSETIKFEMQDGIQISAENYAYSSNKTVILLHGVLANSYTYNKMSGLLREALKAEVIAIDLRGHGKSGGIPGDVSKSNQYAEDLNEIILSIRKKRPNQTIVLAGHSMGGGIVLNHAESYPQTSIDAYLLFAPNLGITSPTTSQDLNLTNTFIKTHLSRGLGLRMLNEMGIHQYDSLQVAFYNLPEQMPIRSYSYRSMEASYPKNFKTALSQIKAPLLTLVGSEDEAFIAHEYPVVMKAYSKGDCVVVEGETHNGIRHSAEAMLKIKEWAMVNKL